MVLKVSPNSEGRRKEQLVLSYLFQLMPFKYASLFLVAQVLVAPLITHPVVFITCKTTI